MASGIVDLKERLRLRVTSSAEIFTPRTRVLRYRSCVATISIQRCRDIGPRSHRSRSCLRDRALSCAGIFTQQIRSLHRSCLEIGPIWSLDRSILLEVRSIGLISLASCQNETCRSAVFIASILLGLSLNVLFRSFRQLSRLAIL